jgi:hypothetical protein
MSEFGFQRGSAIRLLAGVVVMVIIWCGILPRLLDLPPVARHVALMEARQVDPSAMYYTELERLPLRPAWIDELLVLWP